MKKMISWNVNGLRAAVGKNFKEVFDSLDADIFCIQETKLQEGQIDLEFDGYKSYWNYAEKKGYAGTAIFTKEEPKDVFYGINEPFYDNEGRVITLEFENYFFLTCYTPNSQSELKRLEYRMSWEEKFGTLLDSGFIDTFRYFYPDEPGRYSWWSYRFNARKNNAGWRIDYFLVSEELKDKLVSADILSDIQGSDHCPVELVADI